MSMKYILTASAVAIGIGFAGLIEAAPGDKWNEGGGEQDEALHLTPNLDNGRDVYEVCTACHMPEGWGTEDGTFPQIAGQHRSVAIKQLADIRALNRDNPTMYPFALPSEIGGPQAIADVTAYMEERLLMNPNNGKGPWEEGTPEFERGKKLYDENCVRCHGEKGEGNPEKYYPLIKGQHYNYVVRQFEWIRDGKRRNANPEMVEQIARFTDEDVRLVNNYASRLAPLPDKIAPEGWINPDFD